jgi:hypothetical protein
LKVNEAVYYKDNPITLLSEYQIREYGFVIDSVAKKHRKSSTEMGSQRFVLSQHLHVPFDDRGGIMGFEILPILPNDFHNGEPLYDVFEITGAAQWTPSQFCLSPTYFPAHTPTSIDNEVSDHGTAAECFSTVPHFVESTVAAITTKKVKQRVRQSFRLRGMQARAIHDKTQDPFASYLSAKLAPPQWHKLFDLLMVIWMFEYMFVFMHEFMFIPPAPSIRSCVDIYLHAKCKYGK